MGVDLVWLGEEKGPRHGVSFPPRKPSEVHRVRTGPPGYRVELQEDGDRCARSYKLEPAGGFAGTAWTEASHPLIFTDAMFDHLRRRVEREDAGGPEEFRDPRYRFCARASRHRLWRGLHTWARVAGSTKVLEKEPLPSLPLQPRSRLV